MGRRKKDEGWFESCTWIFTRWSAWHCIPVAIVVLLGINLLVLIGAAQVPILKNAPTIGPMLGGALALVMLIAGASAGVEKLRRKKIYESQSSVDSIRNLSWAEFELLIGEAYRRRGYRVTETGGGGADGGIDLFLQNESEKVIVQCKQWKVYNVGVRQIRELYGVLVASGANRALFVTSGIYTKEAREFAEDKPIELIDGESLSRLIDRLPAAASSEPWIPAAETTVTESGPACPKCRATMVIRTARKGSNAGSRFWGCSTFPHCKAVPNLGSMR